MITNALAIFIGIALGILLGPVAVPVGVLVLAAWSISTHIMEAHDRRDHRAPPAATARQIRAARAQQRADLSPLERPRTLLMPPLDGGA